MLTLIQRQYECYYFFIRTSLTYKVHITQKFKRVSSSIRDSTNNSGLSHNMIVKFSKVYAYMLVLDIFMV